MWTNTTTTWGSAAKTLHWLIAFFILIEVPVGFLMSNTYGPAAKDVRVEAIHILASQIHHTLGFVILALAVFRLGWRFRNPVPAMPTALATYERWLAYLTHGCLYALLLLLPLSGWAALSVFAQSPMWFFGGKNVIPFILPKLPLEHPFSYGFFANMHVFSYEIGAVLLTLHIGAALWHHWVRKDNVLWRMMPTPPPQR